MLISPAFAQAAGGAGGAGGLIGAIAPLLLIFVIFYFLLIRPQQKRMKEHQAMLNAIRRGDKVITGGGIIGQVSRVFDDERELLVEIAENVKIRVKQDMVSTVVSKTEPVAATAKDTKDKDSKD